MDTPGTASEDLFASAAIEIASFEMAFDRPAAAMLWLERAGPFVATRWLPRWHVERAEAAFACGNDAVVEASTAAIEGIAAMSADRWASAAVLRLRALTADTSAARSRWAALSAAAFTAIDALTDAGRALVLQADNDASVARRGVALARAATLFRTSGALAWEQRARARIRPLPDPFDDLTDAERVIASHVADGARNKEIARLLNVSLRTVESHLEHVYRKLGVRSRTELTRLSLVG